MNPSSSNKYKTTDLVLSTFLREIGFDAEAVKDGERKGGKPVGAWLFEDSVELRTAAERFESGQATVEPKSFHDAVNRYREELFGILGIGRR